MSVVKSFSCKSLLTPTADLQIVRFVLKLLSELNLWEEKEKNPTYTVRRLRDIVSELKGRHGADAMPMFIPDEVIVKSEIAKAKLRLARNVLRSAGLVAAVTMGAESCVDSLLPETNTRELVHIGVKLLLACRR